MSLWRDEAFVLSSRAYGETSAVVSIFSRNQGHRYGLVRGGNSPAKRAILQAGNCVFVEWKGRNQNDLGVMRCELIHPYAARLFHDPQRLRCLSVLCAMLDFLLPEHMPDEAFFEATDAVQKALATEIWPTVYAHWELALLHTLGVGLDLTCCAVTGRQDSLIYVSPNTGRAVCQTVGEPYHEKLLPLPAFLQEKTHGSPKEIVTSLVLSGYFLDRYARHYKQARLPGVRHLLCEQLAQNARIDY